MAIIVLFWITLLLIFSTYILYPFIIWLLTKLKPFEPDKKNIKPSLSVIISAYNEEKNIEKKIQNVLSCNYPKNKIEIIIGSDGSTDNTALLAQKYEADNVKVIAFPVNRGKTAVQNDCVKTAQSEIIVFTDAASFFEKDTLTELVKNFWDQRIGCVAGKMLFVDTDKNMNTQSQGIYWKYESMLRKLESKLGQVIGVDGPLYAVRKEDYVPLQPHVISDFITPLIVLSKNKKVVFEENAIIKEEPTQKSSQEFKTRRRISLRAFQGLKTHPDLINPLKNFMLSFQIFFHKIIRWLVGILLLINLISVILIAFLPGWFFKTILILYLILFLSAGLGFLLNLQKIKIRILAIPYYFILVNLAATMGFVDFLKNKQAISWKPVR